jgi:hypothetical protein
LTLPRARYGMGECRVPVADCVRHGGSRRKVISRTHHAGEDHQLLPALRAAAPELAPVIDKLIEDHALVAAILRRIRESLTPGPARSSPGALTRELDGLMAILESHFSYEERRLARALDILGHGAWTADVFTTGQLA